MPVYFARRYFILFCQAKRPKHWSLKPPKQQKKNHWIWFFDFRTTMVHRKNECIGIYTATVVWTALTYHKHIALEAITYRNHCLWSENVVTVYSTLQSIRTKISQKQQNNFVTLNVTHRLHDRISTYIDYLLYTNNVCYSMTRQQSQYIICTTIGIEICIKTKQYVNQTVLNNSQSNPI